jgi:hypothetical protein
VAGARATGAANTGSSSMRILRNAVMANSCFFGLSEAFDFFSVSLSHRPCQPLGAA